MAFAIAEPPPGLPPGHLTAQLRQADALKQLLDLQEPIQYCLEVLQLVQELQVELGTAGGGATAAARPAAASLARQGTFHIGSDCGSQEGDGASDYEHAFERLASPLRLPAAEFFGSKQGIEAAAGSRSGTPEPSTSRSCEAQLGGDEPADAGLWAEEAAWPPEQDCQHTVEVVAAQAQVNQPQAAAAGTAEEPSATPHSSGGELSAAAEVAIASGAPEDGQAVALPPAVAAAAPPMGLRQLTPMRSESRYFELDMPLEDGLVQASAAELLDTWGHTLFEDMARRGFFDHRRCCGDKERDFRELAQTFLTKNASTLGVAVLHMQGRPRWHPPLRRPGPALRSLGSRLLGAAVQARWRHLRLVCEAAHGLWRAALQAHRMQRALRDKSPRPPPPPQAAPRCLGVDALIQRVRQQRQLREATRYCELAAGLEPEQPCPVSVASSGLVSALQPKLQAGTAAPCTWVAPIASEREVEAPADAEKHKLEAGDGLAEPEEAAPASAPSDGESDAGSLYEWEEMEQRCRGPWREAHAQEAPRERRAHSWGRTLSYAKVALGTHGVPVRMGSAKRPFVIWVLCATDTIEAWLAEQGFLDTVNWVDEVPTEVVLLGSDLRTLQPREASTASYSRATGVPQPEVSTASYARASGMARPDLVAVLMPSPEAAGCIPPHVLQLVQGVPAVVSTRFELTSPDRSRLSCQMLFPQVRCPFSGCPDSTRLAYDDNGWIFGVPGEALAQACNLKVPALAPPPNTPWNKADRKPVVFWGILDLKFDTSLPILDRLKILEAGDGKTSKFSHDGKEIRDRYDAMYKVEVCDTTVFDIFASDKKFLHDFVEEVGYRHLLPGQVCFLREYTPRLAEQVAAQLGLSGKDHVILKLCNKTRAAGVVMVQQTDLDKTLKDLLTPPEDMEAWFKQKTKPLLENNNTGLQPGMIEENRRHWWSNESPVFIAERRCTSLLTVKNGRSYDGTLRVGFALRPRGDDLLDVEWLGSYWKLPKKPKGAGKLCECVISAARTSGTDKVDPAHLSEVFAALGDVLPKLFGVSEPGVPVLKEMYQAQKLPELAAYFTARIGAAKMQKPNSVKALLGQAESMILDLEEERQWESLPMKCVKSFVERWRSVVVSREGREDFDKQNEDALRSSLEFMPSNANTLYIKGVKLFQQNSFREAIKFFHRSLTLDPDFKAPYVYLGVCHLRREEFQSAVEISEAGHCRHPGPQFHYHIGVALANLDSDEDDRLGFESDENKADQWQRALDSLRKARSSSEAQGRRKERKERCKSPWLSYDDKLVNWLESRLEMRQQLAQPRPFPKMTPDVGWCGFSFRV